MDYYFYQETRLNTLRIFMHLCTKHILDYKELGCPYINLIKCKLQFHSQRGRLLTIKLD